MFLPRAAQQTPPASRRWSSVSNALGRLQFAEEFASHPSAEADALIEAKTFLTYQRQLNNLSIQKARLHRQCEKDTAELAKLQQLRAKPIWTLTFIA